MDARQALLLAEKGLAELAGDPIKAFRFSSYAQRRFFQAFHEYREVYLRAGNQSGKTYCGAMFFVALMRGVREVCGDIVGVEGIVERHKPISLPMLGTPVSGVVLAQGREQAKESVILAVRSAIGSHPHHIERNSNSIAAIWVKPDNSRSDDWRDWSCVRFFVEAGQSVSGMRLDFAWADEPPDWEMWTELRRRGRRNRPYLRGITATPIDMSTWKPLRHDYREIENRKVGANGKIEIRMSVYDNKALSREHIRQVEQDFAGDWEDAAINGDYINVVGQNPFDKAGLKRWAGRCTDGKIVQGLTPDGATYQYEVWEEREDGVGYLFVADPSAGIEDKRGEHDPSCYWVVKRTPPYPVVERYNGYLTSWDLGWLARERAEYYNRALMAWEHNSGYGESFWKGTARPFGSTNYYGNPYVEFHGDRAKLSLSQRLGWLTTATTRGTIIGALQKAIKQDGITLYSRQAVESLASVVLKKDGLRAEAGAGAHDEDMIVGGLACHLLETMPYYAPPREPGSRQLARELGLRMNQPRVPDPFAAGY